MLLVRGSVSSGATDWSSSIRRTPCRSIPTAALRTVPPDLSRRNAAKVRSRSVSQETSGTLDAGGGGLRTVRVATGGGADGPAAGGRHPASTVARVQPSTNEVRLMTRLTSGPECSEDSLNPGWTTPRRLRRGEQIHGWTRTRKPCAVI